VLGDGRGGRGRKLTDHGEQVFSSQGGVCQADCWGFLRDWVGVLD
jgi:hypothetical protein